MSLTQNLKWSLNNVVRYKYSLSPASNWFVTLYYIIASLHWAHPPNMAVDDLAFYYTLYLWIQQQNTMEHELCLLRNCQL